MIKTSNFNFFFINCSELIICTALWMDDIAIHALWPDLITQIVRSDVKTDTAGNVYILLKKGHNMFEYILTIL